MRLELPLLGIVGLVLASVPPAHARSVTERVSASSAGVPASSDSEQPAVSGDGRFVVFDSGAADLVPGDANRSFDVFVRDRLRRTTRLVSLSSTGAQGNAGSGLSNGGPGTISRDGRYVAFFSAATNLVPGDDNGKDDVFVRDLRAGTTVRASVGTGGRQGDGNSYTSSISATGRYVLFVSTSRNLVAYGGARRPHLYVRDLEAGTTTLEGPDSTGGAAITPDGRLLVFASPDPDLAPGHPDAGPYNVYLRDRRTGAVSLVSATADGKPADGQSFTPLISDDGSVVAFGSVASDIVPGGAPPGLYGTYVRDLRAGTTTRVAAPDGRPPDDGTELQGMSADGRRLLLDSFATDLVPGDTNGEPDLFLHDRRTRGFVRVSVGSSGRQANGPTYYGALSADGRVAAFPTEATDLVPGSVEGRQDVLARAPVP